MFAPRLQAMKNVHTPIISEHAHTRRPRCFNSKLLHTEITLHFHIRLSMPFCRSTPPAPKGSLYDPPPLPNFPFELLTWTPILELHQHRVRRQS